MMWHCNTPQPLFALESFESEPHSEGFTACPVHAAGKLSLYQFKAFVQAEVFWHTNFDVGLFLSTMSVLYLLPIQAEGFAYPWHFYFTPDACRKRGTLNSQKDGWEYVKLVWYIPSVTCTALCLMRLCTVNAVFKRTNMEILTVNVDIHFNVPV